MTTMEFKLTELLILGIFIIPTLFIIFYSIEFYFKKMFRTRNEYKSTRGTTHKTLLTNGLNNLLNETQRTKKELTSAIKAEKNLQKEKDLALEKAASSILFETEFTKIPGIGKVLKEKVRRTCFDGTLKSLNRAWGVHGIGQSKTYEIYRWVEKTQKLLPRILKGNFPNKQQIINKYNNLLSKASNEISNTESMIKKMVDLENTVQKELNKLNSVTISTYKKSYDGDVASTDAVTEYYMGCFPEWKRMPNWFKNLMEDYG